MQMKKFFALAIMALGFAMTAAAQTESNEKEYSATPYSFITVQGGAQTTITNFDQMKLITPTVSLSYGAFFSPIIGGRIHVNGMWNKGGLKVNGESNFTYKYKYITTDLDLLLNLVTLFGRKDYYPLNLYFIAGLGVNYAWDNDDLKNSPYNLPYAWDKSRISHNLRLGLMLDYNLSKHWSVNLEVDANALSDRYNSKKGHDEDWQFTAQLGLSYKFGYKPKPVVPVVIPEPEPEPEPEPAPVVVKEEPKPVPVVVKKPELRTEIFYAIRETVVTPKEKGKLDQLISFLKENTETKVVVTGYADAGTGNPRVNMGYSKERAANVAKALTDAGIDMARITVDAKGDTVQPFSENDKNRVTIAIAQ